MLFHKPHTGINYKRCGPSSASTKENKLCAPEDKSANCLRCNTFSMCLDKKKKVQFVQILFSFFFPPTDPIFEKKYF
jgi:hypothetical protein